MSRYYVEVPVQVLVDGNDPKGAWEEAVSRVNIALENALTPNQVKSLDYRPHSVDLALPPGWGKEIHD